MRKEHELKMRERNKANPTDEAIRRGSSFHGAFMSPVKASVTPDIEFGSPASSSRAGSRASALPTDLVRCCRISIPSSPRTSIPAPMLLEACRAERDMLFTALVSMRVHRFSLVMTSLM
jgi:hypothetical protein